MRRRQGDFGAGPVLSLAGAAALMLALTVVAHGLVLSLAALIIGPLPAAQTALSLSRKQADNLLTALSGATFESYDSKQIQEIILEEAESYFAGQKPLEEVCENMQKRVQLFLDE